MESNCFGSQGTDIWQNLKQKCAQKNTQLEDRERYLQSKIKQIETLVGDFSNSSECLCNQLLEEDPVKDCSKSNCINMNADSASLKSLDIDYMSKIVDLYKKEKRMKRDIEKLEQRERSYKDALNDFESDIQKGCNCNKDSDLKAQFEKMNRELKNENRFLKGDLEDMRLELKQCLERIEGPMQHQLEREQNKCRKLERQLQLASDAMSTSQDCFLREMNNMKTQLSTACSNVVDLNTINQKMKRELCSLDCKCAELEDDLVTQKMNEAETITRIARSLERQQGISKPPCTCPSAKVQAGRGDECGDLYTVARRLSKSLQDSVPCEECAKLPQDLMDTARGLKDIADMVQGKGVEKKADKKDCICQSSFGANAECQCDLATICNATTCIQEQKSAAVETKPEGEDVLEGSEMVEGGDGRDGREGVEDGEGGDGFAIEVRSSTSVKAPEGTFKTSSKVELSSGKISMKSSEKLSKKSSKSRSKTSAESSSASKISSKSRSSKESSSKAPSKHSSKISSKTSSKISSKSGSKVSSKSSSKVSIKSSEGSLDASTKASFKSKTSESKSEVSSKGSVSAVSKSDTSVKTSSKTSSKSARSRSSKSSKSRSKTSISEAPSDAISKKISSSGSVPRGYEIIHGVTAEEKDDLLKVKSSTSVKRMGEDVSELPFDIETKVDVLDKPPEGVHVVTTITGSGTLEVVTEGPTGMIETTMTYTDSGKIEVVTEYTNYEDSAGPMQTKITEVISEVPEEDLKQAIKEEESRLDSKPSGASDATEVTLKSSMTISTEGSEGTKATASASSKSALLSRGGSEAAESRKSVNISEDVSVFSEGGQVRETIKAKVSTEIHTPPSALISEDVSAKKPIEELTESEHDKDKPELKESDKAPPITEESHVAKPYIDIIGTRVSVSSIVEVGPEVISSATQIQVFTGGEEPATKAEMYMLGAETKTSETRLEEDAEKDKLPLTVKSTEDLEKIKDKSITEGEVPGALEETIKPMTEIPLEEEPSPDLLGADKKKSMPSPDETDLMKAADVEGERVGDEPGTSESPDEGGITGTPAEGQPASEKPVVGDEIKKSRRGSEEEPGFDDLKNAVYGIMNKANDEVMHALDDANKNVIESLDKANRDVEDLLSQALKARKKASSTTSSICSAKAADDIIPEVKEKTADVDKKSESGAEAVTEEFQALTSEQETIEPKTPLTEEHKAQEVTGDKIEDTAAITDEAVENKQEVEAPMQEFSVEQGESGKADEKLVSPSKEKVADGSPPGIDIDKISKEHVPSKEGSQVKIDTTVEVTTGPGKEERAESEKPTIKEDAKEEDSTILPSPKKSSSATGILKSKDSKTSHTSSRKPSKSGSIVRITEGDKAEDERAEEKGAAEVEKIPGTTDEIPGEIEQKEKMEEKTKETLEKQKTIEEEAKDIDKAVPSDVTKSEAGKIEKDGISGDVPKKDTLSAELSTKLSVERPKSGSRGSSRRSSVDKTQRRRSKDSKEEKISDKRRTDEEMSKKAEGETIGERRPSKESKGSRERRSSKESERLKPSRSDEKYKAPPKEEETRPSSEPKEDKPSKIPKRRTSRDTKCACTELCPCDVCVASTKQPYHEGRQGAPDDCTCQATCTCKKCLQQTRKEESDKFEGGHPPDCTCIECLCKPCKPISCARQYSKHPDKCRCYICKCKPECRDPIRTKRKARHPKGCACQECHCIYEDEEIDIDDENMRVTCDGQFENIEHKRTVDTNRQHGEDCECVDCLFEKCGSNGKDMTHPCPLSSKCLESILERLACKCRGEEGNVEFKRQQQIQKDDGSEIQGTDSVAVQPGKHAEIPGQSTNIETVTEIDVSARNTDVHMTTQIQMGRMSAEPEATEHPGEMQNVTGAIEQPGEIQDETGAEKTLADGKTGEFGDKETGEEITAATPSAVPPCDCDICECEECADKSKVKTALSTDHPPDCDCQQCSCESCPDPKIQKRTQSQPQGGIASCDCDICKCDDCADKTKAHKGPSGEHGSSCGCPKCVCVKCNKRRSHEPSCNCEICKCKTCPDENVAKKKMLSGRHPLKCDCEICKCEPCRDPNKTEKHGSKICAECECLVCVCTTDKSDKTNNDQRKMNFSTKTRSERKSEACQECKCVVCECENSSKSKNKDLNLYKETVNRKSEVNEIRNVLNQIRCACAEAEIQAIKRDPYIKTGSNFETTLSGLQMALDNVRDKCKTKDNMIAAMVQELSVKANSNVFGNMFESMATGTGNTDLDFTRADICNMLPQPRVYENLPDRDRSEEQSYSSCQGRISNKLTPKGNLQPITENEIYNGPINDCTCIPGKTVDVSSMEIMEIRRLTQDSLLMKWSRPESNLVTGYHIIINGAFVSKILSGNRTNAVIHALDLNSTLNIELYAVTKYNRCQPPAMAVYKINEK